MALPAQLRPSMLPSELEFIATDTLVKIRPTVKMDKLALLSGIYGPFAANRSTEVPLWMAVNLKLKKKCIIEPPEWLTVESLQELLTSESTETANNTLFRLPFRYAEIGKVLLDVASDDLENPDKLRTLLKDVRELRQAKVRDMLLKMNPTSLQLDGICSMELNEVRPFFSKSMGTLIQLKTENLQKEDVRDTFGEEEDGDYA